MLGRRKPQPQQRSDGWMVTYTDLATLLLTFFVMLISMSVVADHKKMAALRSVVGAFGNAPGGRSPLGSENANRITDPSAPMKQEDLEYEEIRNLTVNTPTESNVSVVKEEERIIITLGGKVLFDPGSAKIQADGGKFLKDLAGILKETTSRIELRGYTDPSETVLEKDSLRPFMMLSAKRAFAVYHLLEREGGLPTERMVTHGFGSNVTGGGDLKTRGEANRQAQIILDYRDRVPYRMKRSRGNLLVEFKGFIFKILEGDDEK